MRISELKARFEDWFPGRFETAKYYAQHSCRLDGGHEAFEKIREYLYRQSFSGSSIEGQGKLIMALAKRYQH